MKDIVEELRAMAKLWEERKAPWDETTLLHSAAAEIERMRKAEGNPYAQGYGGGPSFADIVKDLKLHLRGQTDG